MSMEKENHYTLLKESILHDFNCTDADDMYFGLMAERTEYLKKNPEGVKKMSKIMDEIAKEASIRASIRTYREFNLDDAVQNLPPYSANALSSSF